MSTNKDQIIEVFTQIRRGLEQAIPDEMERAECLAALDEIQPFAERGTEWPNRLVAVLAPGCGIDIVDYGATDPERDPAARFRCRIEKGYDTESEDWERSIKTYGATAEEAAEKALGFWAAGSKES